MNADLDPIIGKIKKCLSLSQSDNPHEAASALRQAQALMRKHGLDEVTMANLKFVRQNGGFSLLFKRFA